MFECSIRDFCDVCSNIDGDTFVGIICNKGDFSVRFPMGFSISQSDRELRTDIILLMSILASTTNKQESVLQKTTSKSKDTGFPFQAYLFLITDFVEHGYFRENEILYRSTKHGKISWSRTIKTQKPVFVDDNAIFLKFMSKRVKPRDNELITLIHEYCVYESFAKIGWLFTSLIPPKPRISLDKKMFETVIRSKIANTYNDRNRLLFQNMLAIIRYLCDANAPTSFRFGTHRFEYVWEKMIDSSFGIREKEVYFPRTIWSLNKDDYLNACLEPDSIMIWNNDVYVLDAKYYKYGITQRACDLPESTAINKQITYGEYIAEEKKFQSMYGEGFQVYNAFLMPFDSSKSIQGGAQHIQRIGEATSTWKKNLKPYERIQGILVDTKYLMQIFDSKQHDEISKLASCISNGFSKSVP